MRRVVITGMGAICGNGSSVAEIRNAIWRGEAARRSTSDYFDINANPGAYTARKEGLITTVCGSPLLNVDLGAPLGITGREVDRYDRHQLLALFAAEEAMRDAKLLDHDVSNHFGCVCGTGDGGLHEAYLAAVKLHTGGKLDISSNFRELPNVFVGYLTQRYRLRGPSHVHVTACAASAHAIMHAADLIKLGRADVMMTGGAEAVITPFGIASFASQMALSNKSIPYQKERRGFLMGEGAAILILEEYERAVRRGAKIYAEIAGYGATSDGEPNAHIAMPGDGGIDAAIIAMSMAGIEPLDIGYINTHGTGTKIGDVVELRGIRAWCGDRIIPLSSTKSYTGHLLGAAGAIEAILTTLMLFERWLIPTHGLTKENLDPECGGHHHLMEGEAIDEGYALSSSLGFGGTNAAIVFKQAA